MATKFVQRSLLVSSLALPLAASALPARTIARTDETHPPHGSATANTGVSPRLRGGFGRAVAVGNGEVLVGEPENSTRPGTVYVYRKSGPQWVEASHFTAEGARVGDGFGAALDLDGNRLIVGAFGENALTSSTAYIFERSSSGDWHQVTKLPAPAEITAFGMTVALSGDFAMVGAPLQGGSFLTGGPGAVYVFRRNAAGEWEAAGSLAASQPKPQNSFGIHLAMDGANALIATQGSGVFAYHFDGSAWQEAGKPAPDAGGSAAAFGGEIAIAGNVALIGASARSNGPGRVLRFRRDATTNAWLNDGEVVPPDTSVRGFGNALALDGDRLLVSAAGGEGGSSVWVFQRDARGAWSGGAPVRAPGVNRNDEFGGALALHNDIAAIALTGADFGAGKAIIFETGGAMAWTPASTVMSAAEGLEPVIGKETKCAAGSAARFSCGDVDLLAFMPISALGGSRGVNLNDIWGWTDPQTAQGVRARRAASTARLSSTSAIPCKPVYVGDLPMTAGAIAQCLARHQGVQGPRVRGRRWRRPTTACRCSI